MHVILANPSKHLFQVCHMLGHVMRLDDHVIHVDFNISSYLLFEDDDKEVVAQACTSVADIIRDFGYATLEPCKHTILTSHLNLFC